MSPSNAPSEDSFHTTVNFLLASVASRLIKANFAVNNTSTAADGSKMVMFLKVFTDQLKLVHRERRVKRKADIW